jgi:hypothetical protein
VIDAPAAVLLAGLFGTGKSSVAVEMADVLEKRGVPYALIDLDYLCWGEPGSDEPGAEHRMMLRNLAPVVANYLDAGVTRFVLARGMRDRSQVESLRETLGMPLTVERRVVGPERLDQNFLRDASLFARRDVTENFSCTPGRPCIRRKWFFRVAEHLRMSKHLY